MRYFLYSEFDQKKLPGSGEKFMKLAFMMQLDALRHKCGFPFIITSGYRTPEYNNEISTTGLTGAHTTGKAADIAADSKQSYIIIRNAFEMGCFTGIGVGRGFVHLDTLKPDEFPRPRIWQY